MWEDVLKQENEKINTDSNRRQRPGKAQTSRKTAQKEVNKTQKHKIHTGNSLKYSGG